MGEKTRSMQNAAQGDRQARGPHPGHRPNLSQHPSPPQKFLPRLRDTIVARDAHRPRHRHVNRPATDRARQVGEKPILQTYDVASMAARQGRRLGRVRHLQTNNTRHDLDDDNDDDTDGTDTILTGH